MSPPRPQARFLARGSVLVIGFLALWWFVLLSPLLFVLRGSEEILGSIALGVNSGKFIAETASGDWRFTVPVEVVIPNSPGQRSPTTLRSIEFDLARTDAVAFTFGLPVYWAISLAVSPTRRGIRPLVWGTILVAILETILLLAFVQIAVSNIAAQLSHSQDSTAKWFLSFGNYLVINVIPYVAPFLIAISVHRELRCQILGLANAQPLLAPGIPAFGARVVGNRRRSKRQRRRLGPARRA